MRIESRWATPTWRKCSEELYRGVFVKAQQQPNFYGFDANRKEAIFKATALLDLLLTGEASLRDAQILSVSLQSTLTRMEIES